MTTSRDDEQQATNCNKRRTSWPWACGLASHGVQLVDARVPMETKPTTYSKLPYTKSNLIGGPGGEGQSKSTPVWIYSLPLTYYSCAFFFAKKVTSSIYSPFTDYGADLTL